MLNSTRPKKYFSRYKEPFLPVPNLVENQVDSYRNFLTKSFENVIKGYAPISDYAGKKFELTISDFRIEYPEQDEYHFKTNKLTYEANIKTSFVLNNKILGTQQEQEITLTEVPIMTEHGTFIINGVERVVVPQLARSYGIYFTQNDTKKGVFYGAKIIPSRGVWVELDVEADGGMYVRVDKKRKFPVSVLFKVFGATNKDEIMALLTNENAMKIASHSLAKDTTTNVDEAFIEIHKRLRDGDLATPEQAREFVMSMFSTERYDISGVGRFQFNKRFALPLDSKEIERRVIGALDIATILNHIGEMMAVPGTKADDIDHLGMRRVRYVGELLEQSVRKGMMQMKRNIQDKMSTIDGETTLPIALINQRPLQARIREFFATNQLSQFMDQENALTEIEHLRRLSALGPGGLTRERAGFEVRDVHTSHYGRICPIHTPEGPNIGLVLSIALYAKINEFGMIETPYVKVTDGKITKEITYMTASEEERYLIAHSLTPFDDKMNITQDLVEVRKFGMPTFVPKNNVQFIDVSSNQMFSLATNLIPFMDSDAANRALMGSNMQKQATPCLVPEAPIVATGMEIQAARYTGRVIVADVDGVISHVDGKAISIKQENGKVRSYELTGYARTNNDSVFNQRPSVEMGQTVKKGDIIADCPTTVNGELAIGQNIFMAFMAWRGNTYEDAIVLSERLVKNNKFATVRVEEYECVVRDTKLGAEQMTPDIPNVGEAKLKNLDEEGIIRVGADVREGDILVGKITPKGETELTPEERLLRSIFGEKARDVKDTSLRLAHGKKGRVISIKVFSREQGHQLESGVIKKIFVEVAHVRPVSVGDKLAGRHGNKGVISVILPEEDMPYTADGTPIDIILTPLGVPSRMNLGQVLELHLGLAANALNYQAIVPPFMGASRTEIENELEKGGFDKTGKVKLFDGRTGEKFDQNVSVGYMYILRLHHMVDDKIHARSIGPYSLITQQPLSGKSQFGGQRFGEMEVWALEGYGAAHILREMLTVKSDDIVGRSAAFDSIIKGENVKVSARPASFHVLLNYLRGLALDVHLHTIKRDDNLEELLEAESTGFASSTNEIDDFYKEEIPVLPPTPELDVTSVDTSSGIDLI